MLPFVVPVVQISLKGTVKQQMNSNFKDSRTSFVYSQGQTDLFYNTYPTHFWLTRERNENRETPAEIGHVGRSLLSDLLYSFVSFVRVMTNINSLRVFLLIWDVMSVFGWWLHSFTAKARPPSEEQRCFFLAVQYLLSLQILVLT